MTDTPRTLSEKVWDRHVVHTGSDDDPDVIFIDLHLVHEVTSPQAFDGLRLGAAVPAFWLLAGSFAICGATTNGLIGTHFIPAANDHGMPTTVAAGLLATIGILDVAGTIINGTDIILSPVVNFGGAGTLTATGAGARVVQEFGDLFGRRARGVEDLDHVAGRGFEFRVDP